MQTTQIVRRGTHDVLDVLGPTIEFLTSREERNAIYCVMVGRIPPGISVPLHSHSDVESFFVLSGAVQVLIYEGDDSKWLEITSGDFVHVPGGVKHAFRNTSTEPVVEVITTTPKLGRFFQEIGRRTIAGTPPQRPAPGELEHFTSVSARYGYWLGSPAENAAIGIPLFS